jgi:hypothetical protein
MCDRNRNEGTLKGMVVISHEDLEAMIQKRIDEALKGVRDAITDISR